MAPAFMCGVHAKPTQGADFRVGISVDQIAAGHIGKDTQLPSLQLSLEPVEFSGSCDSGYSCVYTNTLSWRGPTMPLPMEHNPRAVFERLFGDAGSSDPAVRLRRLRERRSILDSVMEKALGLSKTVGPGDQRRFEEYLQSIRDVERRMQTAEAQSDRELPRVSQPGAIPATAGNGTPLMATAGLGRVQGEIFVAEKDTLAAAELIVQLGAADVNAVDAIGKQGTCLIRTGTSLMKMLKRWQNRLYRG